MGYLGSVEVAVEVDITDVLNKVDDSEIIEYVVDSAGTDSVLEALDSSAVRDYVFANMDTSDMLDGIAKEDIIEHLVKKSDGLSGLLRAVADCLDKKYGM